MAHALLRSDTYEDVEHDRSATLQALFIVVLVSISTGIGGMLSEDTSVVDALVFGIVGGIVSWAVWALTTWIVGSTILKTADTEANWGQLARGTGFAQTPGNLLFPGLPAGNRLGNRLGCFHMADSGHAGRCAAMLGLHLNLASVLRWSLLPLFPPSSFSP